MQATLEVEIKGYLAAKRVDRGTDPLEWWANHGVSSFPLLSKVAFKYLIIPATSVPSERLFSTAGDVRENFFHSNCTFKIW